MAVVAVPDAKFGEVVGAWIIRKAGENALNRQDIRDVVRKAISPKVSGRRHCQSRMALGNMICDGILSSLIEHPIMGVVYWGGWSTGRSPQDRKRKGQEECIKGVEPRFG